MLRVLEDIFETNTIEVNSSGQRVNLSSHTPKEQGLFIQKIYEQINPTLSVEVGFALGISTLFILEKCRDTKKADKCHIVIEPFSWGEAGMHNIKKEGLDRYIDLRTQLSDIVLPSMYHTKQKIQFAYVDTTKIFDTVLHDFYFIDKILDIGGVILIDDATAGGIEMVTRYINTLPHYEVMDKFEEHKFSTKFNLAERLFETALYCIPFKAKFLSRFSFKTMKKLGLNYRCVVFKKISEDQRAWDWEMPL